MGKSASAHRGRRPCPCFRPPKRWAYGPWNEISLQTEGNESFQQAVDRLCTPTRSFYDDFHIPQYFYRLPGGKLLGESKVTKAGVTYEN